MTSGPPTPAEVREPTSPELVLVASPAVARAARDRLPDPSAITASNGRASSKRSTLPTSGPQIVVPHPPRKPRKRVRRVVAAVLIAAGLAALIGSIPFVRNNMNGPSEPAWRALNGSGNNVSHPTWGESNRPYRRLAPVSFVDGIERMEGGPPARYISNRIFNDVGQNLFSENDVSQWGWVWGQFLDHTFGLRNEKAGEKAAIPFDARDPLERFRNDLGKIDFARTPAAPGTGSSTVRQEINTVPSYIDAFSIYGGSESRLEWLRKGRIDGDMSNNGASLLLPGGYLPRVTARDKDLSSAQLNRTVAAPPMDLMGPLVGHAKSAVVSGDVRANENIALTATHTLFAREHNRIVSHLPAYLSPEDRFQIARRIVGAEEQYITYHEFLPALGVRLPPYRGYDSSVDPTLSNEFATVGYRVHSMVHGELEPTVPAKTYKPSQLQTFERSGVAVEREGSDVTLVIPLGLAFGNPDLLESVGLGPLLKGLGAERQYKNDEQIDESLRSILFQIPKPENRDPRACGSPVVQPGCFSVVQDLGAIDIQRGRDHGMPSYNQLRVAYGLEPKRSYADITGAKTAEFAHSRLIDPRDPIDDPDILDFTNLKDVHGKDLPLKSDEAGEDAVVGTRRSTLAARLQGVYGPGHVDQVDAFVGMLCEPHVQGTEFGELQLAMWKRQFQALRDGDRFFYLNDPMLEQIRRKYGIDYKRTLAEIIRLNTGESVRDDVFKALVG
jgi:hypothetical protein